MDLQALEATAGDWCRWHLAVDQGIQISHPFRDPRLVCFALALPVESRAIPGQSKPLFRQAMQGIIPDSIRNRTGKTGFDSIYGRGLKANLAHLERLVRSPDAEQLDIFDLDALSHALRDAAAGLGDVIACERLNKSLALIEWRRQSSRITEQGSQEIPCEPESSGRRHETSCFDRGAHDAIR